jgi:hypothetical protein
MKMRSRAFDSVQGTSELCRLMEELRAVLFYAEAPPGGTSVFTPGSA